MNLWFEWSGTEANTRTFRWLQKKLTDLIKSGLILDEESIPSLLREAKRLYKKGRGLDLISEIAETNKETRT